MSLLTTGKKDVLSVSKGSEIEVCLVEYQYDNVWYPAILEENLPKSKRKKLSVRHLDPLLKHDYLPPLFKTTVHSLIRPVPPPDLFPDIDFQEGDVVDAAHKGGWWSGRVIKVVGNQRYLVYLGREPDVIEIDRKHLRPHLVWKDDEWFKCEKQQLTESDFSAGKSVEVRTEVANLGNVWAPAIAIKENEDETLLVKLNDCTKISLPYSKIRPLQPPSGLIDYKLTENVDALIESVWCQAVVCKVLYGNRYSVAYGPNKATKEVSHLELRPSVEWKDGVWHKGEKVSDSKESSHVVEEPAGSSRIRVTIQTTLSEIKALGTEKKSRVTRSSSGARQNYLPPSTNGISVAEAGSVSDTRASGELGSKMVDVVKNENSPVTSQPEIAAPNTSHPLVVLGVTAATLTKPGVKTQGKTSPRKKLQTVKNQKGSTDESVAEKASVETKTGENVNKRKRGQPRKFISTEPMQKTGVAGNGSKAPTVELADMIDDNRPLASWIHGKSVSQTPDPGLNAVVEKHVDVVETPPVRESTMVLPFVKKSHLWGVLESMEVFRTVPQSPHFSPLLESEEELREGDAIGSMVKFTGLLDKVNHLQFDDPISLINRIDTGFLQLEKHGFNVTAPRSRIAKLLSIKERRAKTLEELKAVEQKMTENDSKRRKCEEDVVELQKQLVLMKEEKVKLDNEIARMQTHAAVLDNEFLALVSAPWK